MRASYYHHIRKAIVGGCFCGSVLFAAEDSDAVGSAHVITAADSAVSQLRQLERQANVADAEGAQRESALTDAQLAQRIVLEEKVLSARKQLAQVLAKSEVRSVDGDAADRQMAEELSKAASAEEREAIIARHRAYRRVMARLADTAATVSQN